MNRDRLTLDFKIRVARDRRSGMTIEEVMEKYGIARSSVYKWTKMYNSGTLMQVKERYTKEEKNAAVMQYVRGATMKDISKEMGIALSTLSEWIDEYFFEEAQERREIAGRKRKAFSVSGNAETRMGTCLGQFIRHPHLLTSPGQSRYLPIGSIYITFVTRKHLGILFYSPLRRAGRREYENTR